MVYNLYKLYTSHLQNDRTCTYTKTYLHLKATLNVPWVPEFFSRGAMILRFGPRGSNKDLTETGNRVRKASGTQGTLNATHFKKLACKRRALYRKLHPLKTEHRNDCLNKRVRATEHPLKFESISGRSLILVSSANFRGTSHDFYGTIKTTHNIFRDTCVHFFRQRW